MSRFSSFHGPAGGPSAGVYSRSTTMAKPMAPAAQTVISPNCCPRRFSSFSSVTVMRPPVRAEGVPDGDGAAHAR